MRALICSHDWSQKLLGPLETWSHSLKTALSILLNACSPMFLIWGADRILFYNDAYSSILKESNYSVPLGQPLHNAWPENWDNIRSDVEQVFTTGQPLRRENQQFPIPPADNSARYFYTWSYSAIWDETDRVGGVFATGCRAINEQTNRLQRQAEELRLITNTVPVLIAYLDRDHRYRFVNETYEAWFGQSPTAVIGKHVREVLGESAYKAVLPYMEQAFSGQRVSFESQIPYRDGGTRYVSADYIPHINSQGVVEGYISLVSDISDRKRSEAERERLLQVLANERAQFEAVLRQMPEGVMIADAGSGSLILANERVDQIFQYSYELYSQLEDYEPRVPFQAYHTDGRPYAPDEYPLARSLHTGEIISHEEMELHYPDGRRIWIDVNSCPIFNTQEQISSAVVVFQDITERQQSLLALRQSEQQTRLAIKVGRLGTWRYDPNTNLVELDERMRQIWGEPEDAVMMPLPKVMERIHSNDRARVASAIAAALDSTSSGTYEIDYCIVWDDGTERWVLANGQAQFAGEGITRRLVEFLGTALDITDRKQAEAALRQSEERYRYLVESIPQLVWTANAEGMLLDVNQRWVDFTGLTLAQAQIEGWQAIVHPEDVPILSQQWAVAQQNGTYYQAEGRMQRQDGMYRWYLHQAIPLKDKWGQISKWFGTATDIDDQKQLAQERDRILQQEQAAREQAERANRIKDEFLAVLSHELRSPLNPILGWARLLQTRKLDEQTTQRALDTIERNAKLQTQLIEDLLDVSRILRGKMVLNVHPVNLVTVIQAAIETVGLAVEAKQIEIQTMFPAEIKQVSGDMARLQQIVWNLFSNAVKFTPVGGKVEIRLEYIGTQAQIQVKDNGKGITKEFLPHVFEYFRQEDGTITRQFGGLGLGLAIVRHLTELHGGTVAVDSPGEGLGATFMVRIPLLPASELPPETNSHTDVINLNGVKILVVDDEADMRYLTKFILEQYGAEVTLVASALEALTVLDRFSPDVLISDIGMPAMDGYMLMRQVRNRSPKQGGQIPAIALTSYAGEFDQKQALTVGFQRHVAKPVQPEELVKAVASIVVAFLQRQ